MSRNLFPDSTDNPQSMTIESRLARLEKNYRTMLSIQDGIQDNVDELQPTPWIEYTTLMCQGTTPITTLGTNGRLESKYKMINGLAHTKIYVEIGTSPNFGGAGAFNFTLPFAIGATAYLSGMVTLLDMAPAIRNFSIRRDLIGGRNNVIYVVTEVDGGITSTSPWTWAAGDKMYISVIQEPLADVK